MYSEITKKANATMTTETTTTDLRNITKEQLYPLYTELVCRAAKLQALYMDAARYFGKEDSVTQDLWEMYVEADKTAEPFRVRMGQLAMQEQIDNMTPDEFESFRRNND